ncbi:uncharacterized protein SCHCODRAFT_02668055 [Schizophyllum commune H4-8]|nr:uncharacterized protein SCHCODRAFT_02668055 [Schizophyllum commune H4-8]KAI5892625.1 hypothetical protein SCHCODRAFT_02668055 [Schizophyllum commune H4-8]
MPVNITPEQAADTAKGLITVALSVTLFRLGIRLHDKRWGWDDFWAALSIVASSLVLTGACISLTPKPWMSRDVLVLGYYFAATGFYCTVWSCRLSILCTIMRIIPNWWIKYFRVMGAAFAGMWLFLFVQALVHCEGDPTWKDTTGQCSLGRPVAIAQLITDIVSDLALSLAPVSMLWQANLPKGQRVRLITVFASCILTTLVSLAHAYCIWVNRGLDEFFAAMFETSVSMMVASLSVLVGFFTRLSRGGTSGGHMSTSGGATGASGIELSRAGRAINVDISTTVWVDDDGERGQAKSHPTRSVEEGLESYDKKADDRVYDG